MLFHWLNYIFLGIPYLVSAGIFFLHRTTFPCVLLVLYNFSRNLFDDNRALSYTQWTIPRGIIVMQNLTVIIMNLWHRTRNISKIFTISRQTSLAFN